MALTPNTILKQTFKEDIASLWCKKLVGLCDGRLTVTDIANILNLPASSSLKLAQRSLDEGWLEIVGTSATSNFDGARLLDLFSVKPFSTEIPVFSDETRDKLIKELTIVIGPVARILVRDAITLSKMNPVSNMVSGVSITIEAKNNPTHNPNLGIFKTELLKSVPERSKLAVHAILERYN